MSKVLQFKVVEDFPTQPYEAYWTGTQWCVSDVTNVFWYLSVEGRETDAVELKQQGTTTSNTSDDILLKALAVALHKEAAVSLVGGDSSECSSTD